MKTPVCGEPKVHRLAVSSPVNSQEMLQPGLPQHHALARQATSLNAERESERGGEVVGRGGEEGEED